MTLDALDGNNATSLPLGWTTTIEIDAFGEDARTYRADIYRNGIHACRIGLTCPRSDGAASQTLKARIARWIADCEARDHSAQ
jgi:hypothetical protein